MLEITSYQKCQCGAIALTFEGGVVNHMSMTTYRKLKAQYAWDLRKTKRYPTTYCCDHCVNHYGIDLCECGSGEPVGKCDCGSDNPLETLGEQYDSFGAMVYNFTGARI